MKVEVWDDNGHCSEAKGRFPYDPSWWGRQDEGMRSQIRCVDISQTLDGALKKAKEFYDSLKSSRTSDRTIVIGQRLD